MWRIPFFTFLLAIFMSPAHAQGGAWQACHGVASPAGPVLGDCRPIADVVDPQGREIWIRSIVQAPADTRPRVLYVAGVASSEAWLNGKRLGANGRPGSAAQEEIPGRYQAIFPPAKSSGGTARTCWCSACRRFTAACVSHGR